MTESMPRRTMLGGMVVGGAATGLLAAAGAAVPDAAATPVTRRAPADSALVRRLPGRFRRGRATVNGVELHYVIGGPADGRPLVLLPGWPRTWWEFRKVMPALAERRRVIAVDLRGMGGSGKPADGYDKKTMAEDIHQLVRHLDYTEVDLVGSDIGAMVAQSVAAHRPDATGRVVLLDVAHPDESLYGLPLLPRPGQGFHLWWFAFNVVPDLPEQLLAGRFRLLVDWLCAALMHDPSAVDDVDRRVFAHAYDSPEAIRAGNGWYRAFATDIVDERSHPVLGMPVLALAAKGNYDYLRNLLPDKASDVRVELVPDSGHYLVEERPDAVLEHLDTFLP